MKLIILNSCIIFNDEFNRTYKMKAVELASAEYDFSLSSMPRWWLHYILLYINVLYISRTSEKEWGCWHLCFMEKETSSKQCLFSWNLFTSWILSQHVLRIITTTPLALLQMIKGFLDAGFIKYHNTYLPESWSHNNRTEQCLLPLSLSSLSFYSI